MGFANQWTPEEIAFLRENYQTMEYAEIAKILGKTAAAVRNKCYKLGLRKQALPWTEEEDALLRQMYSEVVERLFLDEMARRLGRSRSAVASRAHELGLTTYFRPAAKQAVQKHLRNPKTFLNARNNKGRTHGGFREDLGMYFRSRWEANYARYLNWLKDKGEIVAWEYEPETFEFPVSRGTRFYTPDFRVTWNTGDVEYHEVKGYLTQKGSTALKRMERYYPDKKIILINGPIYNRILKEHAREIPGWEGLPKPNPRRWTPEQEDTLRKLWTEGVHHSEIAKIVGHSETAVCVRAQRLGLKRPPGKRARRRV